MVNTVLCVPPPLTYYLPFRICYFYLITCNNCRQRFFAYKRKIVFIIDLLHLLNCKKRKDTGTHAIIAGIVNYRFSRCTFRH